jgi:hypothetical protein
MVPPAGRPFSVCTNIGRMYRSLLYQYVCRMSHFRTRTSRRATRARISNEVLETSGWVFCALDICGGWMFLDVGGAGRNHC